VQRAAAVSAPLRPAGEPREKRNDRAEPHRSDEKRECALRGHATTVLGREKAAVTQDW